jgi:hypothetical protein
MSDNENDVLSIMAPGAVFTSKVQCYKVFSVRNLQIFVISLSVGPWQAFTASSNANE